MTTTATIEQYTIEEMEQVAAGWARTADDFRINDGLPCAMNMRAIRYAQDVAVKWQRRAVTAQRMQQGII
jgi:hypothetical protein